MLRKGETDLPAFMKRYLEDNRRVRQILRDNIAIGRTAGETCDLLARKLESMPDLVEQIYRALTLVHNIPYHK